jgi:hypothetical protein
MTQFPRIAIEAGATGMNLHSAGIAGCESNNYLLRIALESVAAVLAALQDLSCAKNFGSQIRQCSRHVAKKAQNVDQFDSSILFAATPDDTSALVRKRGSISLRYRPSGGDLLQPYS